MPCFTTLCGQKIWLRVSSLTTRCVGRHHDVDALHLHDAPGWKLPPDDDQVTTRPPTTRITRQDVYYLQGIISVFSMLAAVSRSAYCMKCLAHYHGHLRPQHPGVNDVTSGVCQTVEQIGFGQHDVHRLHKLYA